MTTLTKEQPLIPLSNRLDYAWRAFQRLSVNPWFAYLMIVLLQTKRIWGMWLYRDLTFGDTDSYFRNAFGWSTEFSVDLLWSPLYSAYYGSVYRIVPDIYLAQILHRFVIVIVLAVMVLALMRSLLPPYIAWLIAAWWVILPINFNSLYEVHLFAIIAPLSAVLLALYKPSIWTRGGALGILLMSMFLIRNEIVIALGLWTVACMVWELRQIKLRLGEKTRIYFLAYGLPVLLALLVISFFYWRNAVELTPENARLKHTLNVCQIYSFGYKQRHSDWEKSPWTECQELMLRDFGQPLPSMFQAIQSNPPAMSEHFFWNIHLFPAGLQVALFNATSYHENPDYPPVHQGVLIVLIPSLFMLLLFFIGSAMFFRKKHYWWSAWIKPRIWGWLLLSFLAAIMMIVVPMQRPRPSYMFLLTLFLMAILGMCLFIVTHPISFFRRFSSLLSILMIALPIFIPTYYLSGQRPNLDLYKKTTYTSDLIGIPETAIVSARASGNLCSYFIKNINTSCVGYGYEIFEDLSDDTLVGDFLDRQPVPVVVFIVNDRFLASYGNNYSVQSFLANPEQEGWKLVSIQDDDIGVWRFYANILRLNTIDPNLPLTLDR